MDTERLVEFLLARIAEDEAVAAEVRERVLHGYAEDAVGSSMTLHFDIDYLQGGANISIARVLAECEAKRRIVEHISDVAWTGSYAVRDVILADLALPYADHPDYRPEWRP